MYRSLFTCLSLIFLLSSSFAQDHHRNAVGQTQTNEFSVGGIWHPRGLGVNVRSGKYLHNDLWRMLDFDLVSMKDPREYKIKSTGFSPSGLYSYGKLNYAYFMRTGFGIKKQLAKRWYKNTISTEIMVSAGLSSALLKPVYLDIYYTNPDNTSGYLVSERYDPLIHTDQRSIFGNSSFTRGLDELSYHAGAFTKLALNFDWSDYNDAIRAFEIGAVVDFYPKRLPIMALVENRKVFTSLYICLNIGSRW